MIARRSRRRSALLRAGAEADTVWSDEKGTPFTMRGET
jgi:hypothetical protein